MMWQMRMAPHVLISKLHHKGSSSKNFVVTNLVMILPVVTVSDGDADEDGEGDVNMYLSFVAHDSGW
jgi:hypothetical protein